MSGGEWPVLQEKEGIKPLLQRRQLLLAGAALGGLAFLSPRRAFALSYSFDDHMTTLERQANARIGLMLMDSSGGIIHRWRAETRFMLCSTFKLLLVAAVLRRSQNEPALMEQHLCWSAADHLSYMPVTEKHPEGMAVSDLCAAAICYSDNLAANRLLKLLGGPAALTAFVREIGDTVTRIDRIEPHLNTLTDSPMLDSTTPHAMANTVRELVLGNALQPLQQYKLFSWLQENTTGDKAIRAAVPADWQMGDKTGSGEYGTTNDVAVLLPSSHSLPMVLAIYMTSHDRSAKSRQEILAMAAGFALQDISLLEKR